MWWRFSYQERLHMKFGNLRREIQARKPLENENYETWFHVVHSFTHGWSSIPDCENRYV